MGAEDHTNLLVELVRRDLADDWVEWPEGYRSVFSMRTRYAAVGKVVDAWRGHRGAGPLDDLAEVAGFALTPTASLDC